MESKGSIPEGFTEEDFEAVVDVFRTLKRWRDENDNLLEHKEDKNEQLDQRK